MKSKATISSSYALTDFERRASGSTTTNSNHNNDCHIPTISNTCEANVEPPPFHFGVQGSQIPTAPIYEKPKKCRMARFRERVLVCLVVLLALVGVVQLRFLLMGISPDTHQPCIRVPGIAWARDLHNCSKYMLCVAGQAMSMHPCATGKIWSRRLLKCVEQHSPHNDCPHSHIHTINHGDKTPNKIRSHTNTLINDGPVNNRVNIPVSEERDPSLNQLYSHPTQATNSTEASTFTTEQTIITTKDSLPVDVALVKAFFPDHPCTLVNAETIMHHPRKCHWYYNCSLPVQDSKWKLVEPLTSECPYPKLFSLSTKSCLPYNDVVCGTRSEPKAPCEYRKNTCNEPNCQLCESRLASCKGLEDGVHPFPSREWTPWFVTCKDERTLEQATCENTKPIFSPLTRRCVNSNVVPKEHGGSLTSCLGRTDGYHPDETGICYQFFECRDERFIKKASCAEGSTFDPETLTCSVSASVPPCNPIPPEDLPHKFCSSRQDGFYADPYGRCSLYYECKNKLLRAYLKCPFGSFNPKTKVCDGGLHIPAPCGLLPNPCMANRDSLYPDIQSNCMAIVTCQRGYVSRIDPCPDGRVFDSVTKKCQFPDLTSPPCGIAPNCDHKADGRYAAVLKGCKNYYTCYKRKFVGYGICSLDKGGFFFNSDTKDCDFPNNICPPCGTKKNCSRTPVDDRRRTSQSP